MESIFTFICVNVEYATLILFFLILLAGLNIPVSVDILLITAGAIASTCLPNQALWIYMWVYLASCLAAWEAYWLGRILGPRLCNMRIFKTILSPERIDRIKGYLEKFGIFTFLVVRFIPGGVRNGLFMTSGLVKMPFPLFIFRDGVGCFFATATVFYLGYIFGENRQVIIDYFIQYQHVILIVLLLILISTAVFCFTREKKNLIDKNQP